MQLSGRFTKLFLIALAIGLSIRLALIPLTYDYDMYHWGIIIQNINSGNGLYELNGYFYTPIWGYIMGFADLLSNSLFSVNVTGERITELLPAEDLVMKHVATITAFEFVAMMKIPLIIGDVLVGILLHSFIKEMTQNQRKADIGFILWFLSPITIYMSGVQGMFDNYSALFLLLSVMLLMKKHYFLAGFMFSATLLLKLFPAACAFLFLGLLFSRRNEERLPITMFSAFLGLFIGILVWYLPNILTGTVMDSFTVITDRSSAGLTLDYLMTYAAIPVVLIMMILLALRMGKIETDREKRFLEYSMCCMCLIQFVSIGPQYVLSALPLIVIYIVINDMKCIKCWALITIGTAFSAAVLNSYSLLSGLSAYTGLVSYDTVIDGLRAVDENLAVSILITLGFVAEIIGLIFLVLSVFREKLKPKLPQIIPIIDFFENTEVRSDEGS